METWQYLGSGHKVSLDGWRDKSHGESYRGFVGWGLNVAVLVLYWFLLSSFCWFLLVFVRANGLFPNGYQPLNLSPVS